VLEIRLGPSKKEVRTVATGGMYPYRSDGADVVAERISVKGNVRCESNYFCGGLVPMLISASASDGDRAGVLVRRRDPQNSKSNEMVGDFHSIQKKNQDACLVRCA
jgi:hypothetical protein